MILSRDPWRIKAKFDCFVHPEQPDVNCFKAVAVAVLRLQRPITALFKVRKSPWRKHKYLWRHFPQPYVLYGTTAGCKCKMHTPVSFSLLQRYWLLVSTAGCYFPLHCVTRFFVFFAVYC